MTRPKTDYQKACDAAERAFLKWVFCTTDDELKAAFRAMVALTIFVHWADGEGSDECECPICLGDFTIAHFRLRPI